MTAASPTSSYQPLEAGILVSSPAPCVSSTVLWRRRATRVPVLTYHSYRISGADYATNDLVALRADLRMIWRMGLRIVPVEWVAQWLIGERGDGDLRRAVAITSDAGSDFDFRDLDHPTCGPQRALINVLQDFRNEVGPRVSVHATMFVIASPQVRADLDAACLVGRGWMSDDWWSEARRSGVASIQNHSWDHNHPAASQTCQREQRKGSFALIETEAECDAEVADAARYIADRAGEWPRLFAYPGGEWSPYLRDHYLPGAFERHGTVAAFDANGGYVEKSSSRWQIPRLVCGAHWKDPAELEKILREAR